MECSVTAAIAAMQTNPNVVNVSFNSNNTSSYALLPYVATKMTFEPFPFSFLILDIAIVGTRPPKDGTAIIQSSFSLKVNFEKSSIAFDKSNSILS